MIYDRIYFFGDSITLGCNDSTGLGWPGRLCRGLSHNGESVAAYNLGINGDTSLDIKNRWQNEITARNRDSSGLIVFAFGFNDVSRKNGETRQLELEQSLDIARSMLLAAVKLSRVLWVGPTPLDQSVNPMQSDFANWRTYNNDIVELDQAYAKLADELKIDYLSLVNNFLVNKRYQSALVAGDKVHPADDGYELIAENIISWQAWRSISDRKI